MLINNFLYFYLGNVLHFFSSLILKLCFVFVVYNGCTNHKRYAVSQCTLALKLVTFVSITNEGTHLKRLLSSRSAGGSVVMRLTSSCIQWSWERKRSNRRFWALHSCRTSSSSISSLSVTSSLSSSWSMWEVVCRSNFQNMVAAGTGDTALGHRTAE